MKLKMVELCSKFDEASARYENEGLNKERFKWVAGLAVQASGDQVTRFYWRVWCPVDPRWHDCGSFLADLGRGLCLAATCQAQACYALRDLLGPEPPHVFYAASTSTADLLRFSKDARSRVAELRAPR